MSAGAGSEPHKRLHTLLTDRAVGGLDAKDHAEFEHLRAGAGIDPSYEAAAAAIDLALLAQLEPLPESLKFGLGEQAAQHFGFAIPKPREPSSRPRKAAPKTTSAELDELSSRPEQFGDEDFGDELLLGEGETDATPTRRTWEQSPRSEGALDDPLETGVLESSLTDGKVDRSASPADSQRADIVAKLEPRSKSGPGPRPNRRRTDRQPSGPGPVATSQVAVAAEPVVAAKPKAKPLPKAPPEPGDSELGSTVVRMPVHESALARWATYVSAIAALSMLAAAVWLHLHRDDPPDPDAVLEQLEADEDTLEWTFRAEQDDAVGEGAGGRVLWSPERQQGELVVQGLVANDASESQYQLWIVDAQREGPPVPGPVFDVADDEVQVVFDVALVIAEPSAFLITVERPGGVVVSKQDRVAMIATSSAQ
jgi:anti-sigma-K factor RskA